MGGQGKKIKEGKQRREGGVREEIERRRKKVAVVGKKRK